jgi:hypothetical protein
MLTLSIDENELEEIQIDNFLKYIEQRTSFLFDSWEEFIIADGINYYYNHQHKIQRTAMEKIEETRQQCDAHAQAIVKNLPTEISDIALDTQQLNYDRIVALQNEGEQKCREWIATATEDIKKQSEQVARGYENYIQGQLQLVIQECEAEIKKNQAQLQAIKAGTKPPAEPYQQPSSANYTQPEPEAANSSTTSNRWKTNPKSWGKNQQAA